jgi:pyrroloquinoline quinone biosynthesis protein B
MRTIFFFVTLLMLAALTGCRDDEQKPTSPGVTGLRCVVLGNIQDGGHPHPGCSKACCAGGWNDPVKSGKCTSLGIVDPGLRQVWLIEATPDLPAQMQGLCEMIPGKQLPDGILITHAHIGHYSGLMYLGREAMNARNVPVYCLPRMRSFIENNGPWQQLVSIGNITLKNLADGERQALSDNVSVTPLVVPHRDEYSETAGFLIAGQRAKILFIPDIDKWQRWNRSLAAIISQVDIALLDGTFYDGSEVPGRNIKEIPHPSITETMELLSGLPENDRKKIRFIHLNHSNPALDAGSAAAEAVSERGFKIASEGDEFRF